jgi:hypothetical protein
VVALGIVLGAATSPPDAICVKNELVIGAEGLALAVVLAFAVGVDGVDVDVMSVLCQLVWINGAYIVKVGVSVLLTVKGTWRYVKDSLIPDSHVMIGTLVE